MPKVIHVKKARKAIPDIGVEVGESYYHWSRMVGGRGVKFKSKTKPTRQQLTGSAFLSQLYDLEDQFDAILAAGYDDAKGYAEDVEVLVGEIRSLQDETQDSFDNMPQGLQDGDTGQLLDERVNALEAWAEQMESLDDELDANEYLSELENVSHDL